jgi:hypothetical protein
MDYNCIIFGIKYNLNNKFLFFNNKVEILNEKRYQLLTSSAT